MITGARRFILIRHSSGRPLSYHTQGIGTSDRPSGRKCRILMCAKKATSSKLGRGNPSLDACFRVHDDQKLWRHNMLNKKIWLVILGAAFYGLCRLDAA